MLLLYMASVRLICCFFHYSTEIVFCIGGILGAFMTGLFSQQSVNVAGGADGAFYGRPIQLWYQIAGILTAIGE